VAFVAGALPGETVEAVVVQAKRDFVKARTTDVVVASPHRVAPPCPALARGCGGCDWQHIEPAAQLEWKIEVVRDALRRTARLPDASVHAGGAVPAWGYRTSMRFALERSGRPALRRSRSSELVALDDCPVAHPALAEMLDELRIVGADEVSLRVSAATGEASAWWEPADRVAVGLPAFVGRGADATISEIVDGALLRVSAPSFFQSGPAAAALVVDAVRAAAPESATAQHVIDAYGGVGLFAATVASTAAAVTLVEGSSSACADARHNLAGRHATIVESPVERWAPRRADVVIVDPARTGLGAEAADVVAACAAEVVVLVSCDPAALARDTSLLAQRGYRHAGTSVLDLFPQTHHVEAVTRFEIAR
jgi:23S rRNA (uracil1939-C5)-methyltransferase